MAASGGSLQLALRLKAAVEGLSEIAKLAEEISTLGGESEEAGREAQVLGNEIQRLQNTEGLVDGFKQAGAAVKDASDKLDETRAASASASAEHDKLQGNLQASRAALNQVADASAEVSAEVQRASVQVKQADAALDEIAADAKRAGDASADFGRKWTAAGAEVTKAERALQSSESALAKNTTSVATLESRLEKAREAQRDLTNQVIAADAPTDALTQRHEKATNKVQLLQVQLAVAKARTSELTTAVKTNAGALGESERALEDSARAAQEAAQAEAQLKAAMATAQAELERKREALRQQQAALKDVTKSEGDLERAVRADEQALAKQGKELAQLTASTSKAQAALASQCDELARAERALASAGVDTSRLSAEEQRLARESIQAKNAVEDLRQGLGKQKQALQDNTNTARNFNTEVGKLGGGLNNLAKGVLAFAGVSLGSHLVTELAGTADAIRNVESRLKLVTTSTEEFAIAQDRLLQIANDSRTSYNQTVDLYTRLQRSTKDLNLSQERLLAVTEAISQSLQISGAGVAAQDAALTQLGQGLQSGVLRGEEFNSVMEQSPRLAQAMADGLGVPISALRKMAEAGELTTARITKALESQAAAIESEFGGIERTIGGASTKLKNNWAQVISEFDRGNGVSAKVIASMDAIGENLEEIVELATLAGNVAIASLAVKGVKAAGDYATGLRTATINAQALGAAVKGIGLPLALGLVLEYADDLGELAAKWTGVDDAAKAAAENRRVQLDAEIQNLHGVVDQYLAYAQVRIKTAEEASKLTDQERDSYRQQLEGRLQLENAERRRALLMEEMGTATQTQLAAEIAGFREVRNALQQLNDLRGGALGEISFRAQQLAQEFSTVSDEIEKVSNEALADFYARALADLPAATALAKQFGQEFIAAQSEGGAAALKAGEQFSAANGTVKALRDTIEATRTQTLLRLGVDADAVLTGIDSKTRELLNGFKQLASDPEAKPTLITAAFDELLKRLDSPQEIENLTAALMNSNVAGLALEQRVAKVKERLDEINPATKAVQDAFQALGLTSSKALQDTADKAEAAYQTIAKSGAPIGDITRAWEVYAGRVLEAAAAEGDAALKREAGALQATAATQQQQAALQKLLEAYPQLGAAGAAAMGEIQTETAKAGTEFDILREKIGSATELNQLIGLRNELTALYTAGKVGAEDYQAAIDAVKSKTEELAKASQGFGAALAQIVADARKPFSDLSETAAAAFDHMNENAVIYGGSISNYIERLVTGINALNVLVAQQADQADGMISHWSQLADQIDRGAESARYFGANSDNAFVQQRQSLQGYINSLRETIAHIDYLDAERLEGLQNALAAAQSRLDSLRDSAQSALASVQDDLDRLKGDQDAIEDRRNKARLAELQALLAQAQAAKDQASVDQLEAAIRKQRELMALIDKQRDEEEAAAAKTADAGKPSPTPKPSPSPSPSTPAPAGGGSSADRTVRIELVLRSVTYPLYGAPSTADALMDALEEAQRTAA